MRNLIAANGGIRTAITNEDNQNCISFLISGCLPNEFRCTNSCIDNIKRCDKKKDCENGEDEDNCGEFLEYLSDFHSSKTTC